MDAIPTFFDLASFALRFFPATDFFAVFPDFAAFFIVLAMSSPPPFLSSSSRALFLHNLSVHSAAACRIRATNASLETGVQPYEPNRIEQPARRIGQGSQAQRVRLRTGAHQRE